MSIELIPAGTVEGAEQPECPVAARRQAFVDAARDLFFANGYAGTTMSSIAARVGGSKTTLWTYFPSKEELFEAVVDDVIEKRCEVLRSDLSLDEAVVPALRRFGLSLMTMLTQPQVLRLYRLVVGEVERFPHLAQTFYDRGPRRGKAETALWVAEKMARGELRRGDPLRAVYHFAGLCQAGLYQHAILGIAEQRELDRMATDVDAAVDTFYRAWGPED